MEWISVEDKESPRDGTHFLSYTKKWGVQQVHWSNISFTPHPKSITGRLPKDRQGNFTDFSGQAGRMGSFCIEIRDILHWMPLPEPPK